MTQLHVNLAAKINNNFDWLELATDGHWLAIGSGTEWRIIDTKNGDVVWTFSLDSRWIVLSPDGKQVASQLEPNVLIVLNDKGQSQRKRFDSPILEFVFTLNGTHLWIALHNEQKTTNLLLLDTNTLATVDLVDILFAPETLGEHRLSSYEVSMNIHSGSGLVAVTRTAGDTYFDTRFFRTDQNAIISLPHTLSHTQDLRPLHFACFSASGEWFAALDGSCIKIWQLPEMDCIGQLESLEDKSINTFAFLEDDLLLAIGEIDEIRELQLFKNESGTWKTTAGTTFVSPLSIPTYGIVRFLASEGKILIGIDDGQIHVFNIAPQEQPLSEKPSF